ncbi:hypothetical protein APSETT445_008877 [Aspergillus pseudonomiae]
MDTVDLEPQEPTGQEERSAPSTVPKEDLYLNRSYRKNVMIDSISNDFTIICGNQSFPAHKAVVCPQSRFFTKVLNGFFVVRVLISYASNVMANTAKEARSNTINLPDHPLAVRMMLEFLYKSDYGFHMEYNFPSSDFSEGIGPPEDAIGMLS